MSPSTTAASSGQITQAQLNQILAIMENADSVQTVAENIGKTGKDHNINLFKDAVKKEWMDAPTTTAPSPTTSSGGMLSEVFSWAKNKWNSWFGATQAADSALKTTTVATEAAKDVASTTGTLGEVAGIGGKFLSWAGVAYGAYDLIKNFGKMSLQSGALSGMAVGAGIGSVVPGVGTVIGGLVGAVAGGILSLFKNGKHKDQKARDTMRTALQNAGIIDGKYTIGLADGSRYDIGIDGGPKEAFGGRRPFEVDLNNPLAVKMATFASPLAWVVCGGDKKLASDLSGYLANAALSNAGQDEAAARQNMLAMYAQFKVSPEQLLQGVGQLAQNGSLEGETATGYVSVLKDLFSSKAPTQESPVKR